MSENIMQEVYFLLHSIVMGVFITFLYDWLRIFRRVFKHNLLCLSIEDLLFWIACSISVFLMLYRENNGTLRWFAIIGAAVGMALYLLTVSRFFVGFVSKALLALCGLLQKLLTMLLKPFVFLLKKQVRLMKKGRGRMRKLGHFLKNKLTLWGKMVKMLLCKQ